MRGPTEVGAAGVRVYLDANENARFDGGEVSVVTDTLGQYQFDNLNPGSYTVRVIPDSTVQSSPRGFISSSLSESNVGGLDPTQLIEISEDGNVHQVGSSTVAQIDDLIRTNAGVLLGVEDSTDTIFSIDPVTGRETELSQPGENLVGGLAYDPDSDTVYTVTEAAGEFELRIVDQRSGRLSESVQGQGHIVRTMNFGSTFHDFDVISEEATAIPLQFPAPFASTLDSREDGTIFGLQGRDLFQFDFPVAGSKATRVSTLSEAIEAISFDGTDQLFGISTNPSALHSINLASGVVGPATPITFEGESISGLTGFDIGPDGTYYAVDTQHLYTIDPVTGIATQAPNEALPGTTVFSSLSAAEDGALFATLFSTTTPVAQIDPVTGLAVALGDTPTGAPYSAAVVTQSPSQSPIEVGLSDVSDLAFDTVGKRIVGFDDVNDVFFQFTPDGQGSILATAERPLFSLSMAFDGTSFVMFDQDDPTNLSTVVVDPDTGAVSDHIDVSSRLPTLGLFHTKLGEFPYRLDVGTSDDVVGLDFGLLEELPTGADPEGPAFYINELLLDPLFGDNDVEQYVELRGPASGAFEDGTYLVIVEEDNSTTQGEIHGIFDLSNQSFGLNGMMVLLQQGNAYTVDPRSAVLESNAEGFGGLPGNIYTDSHALSDRIDFILGPNAYFLIESGVPPVLGDDIDVDNDGLADPGGVKSGWKVLDSVSFHPTTAITNQAYGDIVLRNTDINTGELTVEPGVQVVGGPGGGYLARIGDSVGSDPDDWVFGSVREAGQNGSGQTNLFEFESGILGVPVPPAFNGRDLDHIGQSNFNGGVHGTIILDGLTDMTGAPLPPAPGLGITVFADENGNDMLDLVEKFVDPDDGIDVENPNARHVLNNVYPGVTLTTADINNNIIFNVTAELQDSRFGPLSNRIFAHEGIPFFTDIRKLRADFYNPVSEVSIDAIGSRTGVAATVGRLEIYNDKDELLDTVDSFNLFGNTRATLTLSSNNHDIAYAIAYSVDDLGSPFGRFDDLTYRQLEASAVADGAGVYEIKNLFPDAYDIGVLRNAQSAGLILPMATSVQVNKNENFEIDFLLGPNGEPVFEDTFEFDLPENSAPGTPIGVVTATDPNGQRLTYSLVGDTQGLVIDLATGELAVGPTADLNFEETPEFQITVAATDTFDLTVTTEVTINLLDVNEPPVVNAEDEQVEEGTPIGSAIGVVQAFDPDFEQDQFLTFNVLPGGSSSELFNVDSATGLITVAGILDFEAVQQASLIVEVRDSFDPAGVTTVTQVINILDRNDDPQILTDTIDVAENSDGEVGEILILDLDIDQVHVFDLIGGSGEEIFDVLPNGTVVVRPGEVVDFETEQTYTIEVAVRDNGSPPRASEGTITINVTPVDEPPVLVRDSATLPEDAEAGDSVATIEAVDPENVTSDFALTLLPVDDAADFDFDPATGELTVAEDAELDFETAAAKILRFEITHPQEATTVETFVVFLGDANDAPVLLTDRVVVSELATPGTIVGKVEVQVRDQDALDTLTVSIEGGSALGKLEFIPGTRTLRVAAGAEFDADGDEALFLDVRVDDGALFDVGTIVVDLNDVNEAPGFPQGAPDIAPVGSGEFLQFVIPDDFIVDPEGREFSVAIFDENNSLPKWLSFDETTRTLSGLADPTLVGDFPLTLRAFEPGPLELFRDISFTITVEQGDTPLTSQRNPLDVDSNRDVAALDALLVINFIGRFGSGVSVFGVLDPFFGFVDTSGDGIVTALDALLVINGIGFLPGFGESVDVDFELQDRDETNDTALNQLLSESSLF